jgi:hypothetical protein
MYGPQPGKRFSFPGCGVELTEAPGWQSSHPQHPVPAREIEPLVLCRSDDREILVVGAARRSR